MLKSTFVAVKLKVFVPIVIFYCIKKGNDNSLSLPLKQKRKKVFYTKLVTTAAQAVELTA